MQSWHTTYLGLKDLPRELSAFELQAFFTFSRAEREVIDGVHLFFVQFTTVGGPRPGAGLRAIDFVTT